MFVTNSVAMVAMATAHTLAKMRENILLWLSLTLAKNLAPKHSLKVMVNYALALEHCI